MKKRTKEGAIRIEKEVLQRALARPATEPEAEEVLQR